MELLLDTRQLLAFATLAQAGSFTQAARELRVTQSAVSHAIQALERRIGCRVFERNSRRVVLTQAGEQLLHHVGRINREMAAACSAVQALRNWGQIHLRIAAPESVCDILLPQCLREIRAQYPNSLICITVADRQEAVEALLAGRVDLAITVGSAPDERLEFSPLFSDQLNFVTLPSHPWVENPPTDPAVIGSEPLLAYGRFSHTWKLITQLFSASGIKPTVVVECDSVTSIRRMVRLGMGVAILARWAVAAELAAGTLACVPLSPRPLTRRWGTLALRTSHLSLPYSVFIESLKRASSGTLNPIQAAAEPLPSLPEAIRTPSIVAP